MKSVFVCSAYQGSNDNLELAKVYCKFVFENGDAPFAPHLIYPQFLDDSNVAERFLGIEAGLVFLGRCEEIWVFTKNGLVTDGMRKEICYATANDITVRAFGATTDIITEMPSLLDLTLSKTQKAMKDVEELLKNGSDYESVMEGLDFLMPDQTEPDEKLDEQWENYHRGGG